jgi:hypothetical protein
MRKIVSLTIILMMLLASITALCGCNEQGAGEEPDDGKNKIDIESLDFDAMSEEERANTFIDVIIQQVDYAASGTIETVVELYASK